MVHVAKVLVAESRVAIVAEQPQVVVVKLPLGQRRRVGERERADKVDEEREVEVKEGIIVVTAIPRGLKGCVAGYSWD